MLSCGEERLLREGRGARVRQGPEGRVVELADGTRCEVFRRPTAEGAVAICSLPRGQEPRELRYRSDGSTERRSGSSSPRGVRRREGWLQERGGWHIKARSGR